MDGPLKAIIDAGKRSVDFLAFALVAMVALIALIQGVDLPSVIGLVVILIVGWIVSRYALLKIQSFERLRDLREHATVEARKTLEKFATRDDINELISTGSEKGGGDGV